MKKILFLLLTAVMYFPLFAQLELIKQKPSTIKGEGKVYALIIGISDYDNIRDLDYADEDAQDFYNFLVKESGLVTDSNNVRLLLNKKATSANVGKELLKLKNRMEEGSTFFIYFAGHGDANGEAQAFLLASDLPKIEDPSLYAFNGGVIHIYFLKDEIRKIISEKKSNVILVTDACRTNELAGSKEGTKTYVNKIMEQNNGEIQFISCAADEKSEEGEDWGQGRGVFSYFFMNGLRGLADNRPQDGKVTVRELFDYVQRNVEEATVVTDEETIAITGKPYRQSPQYCCTEKQNATLVLVNDDVKQQAIAKMATSGYTIKLASNKGRSATNSIETNDTVLGALYDNFYTALDNKQLISPAGNSAWDFFTAFKKRAGKNNPSVFDVTEDIKAALLNDAQNTINAFYSYTDKWGMSAKTKRQFYEEGVEKLRKARSLMNENDPLSPIVKLTRQCMEAAGIFASTHPDDWKRGIKIMDSAIIAFPTNPLPLFLKGRLLYNATQYTEALVYLRKSQALAPRWSMPAIGISDVYYELGQFDTVDIVLHELAEKQKIAMVYFKLGFYYGEAVKDYHQAIKYNKMALELAPEKTNIINNIGAYYERIYEDDSALSYYNRAFEMDSNNAFTLKNIGRYYMDNQDYDKAEAIFQKAMEADSTEPSVYKGLGEISHEKSTWIRFNLGQKIKYWQTAVNYFEKAIQYEPGNQEAYYDKANAEADVDVLLSEKTMLRFLKFDKADGNYYNRFGLVYTIGGDTAKAIAMFMNSLQADSKLYYPRNNLGDIYFEQRQWDSAIKYYREVNEIEYFYDVSNKIETAQSKIDEEARNKEWEERKSDYLNRFETDPDVWQPLAEMYYQNWQFDSAYMLYSKVIENDPEIYDDVYLRYLRCSESFWDDRRQEAINNIGERAEKSASPSLASAFIYAIKNVGDTAYLSQTERIYRLIEQQHADYEELGQMAVWIAEICAVVENNDANTLKWIETALKHGHSTEYISENYNFYYLFENKKFKKLIKKYIKKQEKEKKGEEQEYWR